MATSSQDNVTTPGSSDAAEQDFVDKLQTLMRQSGKELEEISRIQKPLPNVPMEQRDTVLANEEQIVESYDRAITATRTALEEVKQKIKVVKEGEQKRVGVLIADSQIDVEMMGKDPEDVKEMLRNAFKARPKLLGLFDDDFLRDLRKAIEEELEAIQGKINGQFRTLRGMEGLLLSKFRAEYEAELDERVDKLADREKEVRKSLVSRNEDLVKARTSLEATVKRLEQENQDLSAKTVSNQLQLDAMLKNKDKEIDKLQADVEKARSEKENFDEFHKKKREELITLHNNTVNKMQHICEERLAKQKDESDKERKRLDDKYKELERQLRAETTGSSRLRSEIQKVQGELDAKEVKNTSLQEQVDKSTSTMADLQVQVDNLQRKLDSSEMSADGLREHIRNLDSEKSDLEHKVEDLEGQLYEQEEASSSMRNEFQAKIGELQGQLQSEKTKAHELREQVDELKPENSRLQRDVQDLERQKKTETTRASRLGEQVDDLKAKQSRLEGVVQELDRQLAREKARVESRDEEILDLSSSKSNLQAQIHNLQSQLNGEKDRAQKQERSTSEESRMKSEIEQLRSQVEGHKATISSLQGEQKDLESTISNRESNIRTLSTANRGLVEAVHFQVAGPVRSPEEVDTRLSEKIVDLVAKSRTPIDINVQRLVPRLVLTSQMAMHRQSAPYSFWVTSRNGTLDEILSGGQAILNSRSISPDQAAQSHWIGDALEVLADRYLATPTKQGSQIAMLILQAVAYLRGQYAAKLNGGFILSSMQRKVSDLVLRGYSFHSWLPDRGTHTLGYTNSALPADVHLAADQSETFMLEQATPDGSTAYVFKKEDVESIDVFLYSSRDIVLKLKATNSPGIPPAMQSLRIGAVGSAASLWSSTFLGSLQNPHGF
ncbi:MAG: hypothetical protein Q9181_004990 [Wetmoreana brouardii]